MRLVVITGFESSGSVFLARVVSVVLGKCAKFGDWSGYGWNGEQGDDLIIIHRSMPYERNPKKWWSELEQEIEGLESYSKEFIVCTRDLSISKLSRLKRFGGNLDQYHDDDRKAREIFSELLARERGFVFSLESAVALEDAYYKKLFEWLGVSSNFSPKVFDANRPYIRPLYLMRFALRFRQALKSLIARL